MMNDKSQTWHYGLVARYWAEHVTEGPEIAYFQKQIELNGQPALDAGCGAGRLLLPFLRAGLDVDGCDVSPDMLSLCKDKAELEGLKPHLYQQPLHELDLPRKYQTIVACGVFGIGVSRQQDVVALQRFYQHLNPGGLLLLDHYLPYGNATEWPLWLKEKKQLPELWPDTMGKTPPKEGSDYELYSRVVAFDSLEQCITRQMHTLLWQDGHLIDQAEYTLTENLYFRNELGQLLERAGFEIEAIQGGYTDAQVNAEHEVMVFIARKKS
jgi:SAM-dependent methyltransferase